VFISHAGVKSKALGKKLRDWLPDIIQSIEPWFSESDIEAGSRWSPRIAEELNGTHFGIICLTKANCTAPWILFEAGALAKSMESSRVCPYLIDLEPSEIPRGPLTEFQGKRANEAETWQLIQTINNASKDEGLDEPRLERSFKRSWPDLDEAIRNLPIEEGATEKLPDPIEMIPEILENVRHLMRRGEARDQEVSELREIFFRYLTQVGRLKGEIDPFLHDPLINWADRLHSKGKKLNAKVLDEFRKRDRPEPLPMPKVLEKDE
jgi:TIR domain